MNSNKMRFLEMNLKVTFPAEFWFTKTPSMKCQDQSPELLKQAQEQVKHMIRRANQIEKMCLAENRRNVTTLAS